MLKAEEKAWEQLRKCRDNLAEAASKSRTSFFREEDQEPATRIGRLLQEAADACEVSMISLETGKEATEMDRLRARMMARYNALPDV